MSFAAVMPAPLRSITNSRRWMALSVNATPVIDLGDTPVTPDEIAFFERLDRWGGANGATWNSVKVRRDRLPAGWEKFH